MKSKVDYYILPIWMTLLILFAAYVVSIVWCICEGLFEVLFSLPVFALFFCILLIPKDKKNPRDSWMIALALIVASDSLMLSVANLVAIIIAFLICRIWNYQQISRKQDQEEKSKLGVVNKIFWCATYLVSIAMSCLFAVDANQDISNIVSLVMVVLFYISLVVLIYSRSKKTREAKIVMILWCSLILSFLGILILGNLNVENEFLTNVSLLLFTALFWVALIYSIKVKMKSKTKSKTTLYKDIDLSCYKRDRKNAILSSYKFLIIPFVLLLVILCIMTIIYPTIWWITLSTFVTTLVIFLLVPRMKGVGSITKPLTKMYKGMKILAYVYTNPQEGKLVTNLVIDGKEFSSKADMLQFFPLTYVRVDKKLKEDYQYRYAKVDATIDNDVITCLFDKFSFTITILVNNQEI